MTRDMHSRIRRALAIVAAACALVAGGCATEGATGVGYFDAAWYYEDPWYYGGCCVDRPDDIGPIAPHPEHPIAKPPSERPSQPIASPSPRPTPMPRATAMPRGGGGGRGGRR